MLAPPVWDQVITLVLRVGQARTRRIQRIARLDLRMDLVIAVEQFAAIIDIRTSDRAAARERDRGSGRAASDAGIPDDAGVRAVTANATVLIVDAIAGRDAIPELEQPLVASSSAAVKSG